MLAGQPQQIQRAGVLLAASSLTASLLGPASISGSELQGLAITALVAFVISIGASVYILMPKGNLYCPEAGARLCEVFNEVRADMGEVYRRLVYELDPQRNTGRTMRC